MPLQSHTLRVNFLRRFFPILAGVVFAFVVSWPIMNELHLNYKSKQSETRLKVDEIAMTMPSAGQPMQLQIKNPEYIGKESEGHPYVVAAKKIIQDGMKPGASIMNLEQPTARLLLDQADNENLNVEARTGVYDPASRVLDLDGNVVITHSTGYKLNAENLRVNLTEGRSISEQPVSGDGPNGTLSGQKLELLDKGEHIILHGKSKVTLLPEKSG